MPDLVHPGQRLIAATTNAKATWTVDFSAISANAPASPGTQGTETMWITTPSITLQNGRAYRLTIKGLLGTDADGAEGQVRVRKGTIAGQTVFDSFRITTPNSGNYAFDYSNVFSNQLGVDVTTVLIGTVFRASGSTQHVWVGASTTNIAYLHTEDVGPAGDYPGCQALAL